MASGACGTSPPPKSSAPRAQAAVKVDPKQGPAAARHALLRFGFGPRPGQADQVAKQGLDKWLDQQLVTAPTEPAELKGALDSYRNALVPPGELLETVLGDEMDEAMNGKEIKRALKRAADEVAMAELTRHVLSERQVEEVMVDFWTNHFNVFAQKGFVRLFAGDYVERAIRPNALGRFEDLLIATAKHPAMLIYLDNAQSVAAKEGKRRGLNENYARELLELHTLGVDGGYDQKDVIDVARVLTGWSVRRPKEGGLGFVFRKRAHDDGEKTILGERFPAGADEEEGIKLLKLLAKHPSTAKHLGKKLCARFVADDPPADCVEAAARAYRESDGKIADVVRAIFNHPSFWQSETRGRKLKTPLELVASALRALDARPDGTLQLAGVLGRLGEPLFRESVPTGYPESEVEWLSSGAMLSRMSFASMLAAGDVPGVKVDLDPVLSSEGNADKVLSRANNVVFGGTASAETLATVRAELEGLEKPEERRAVALALLIGSPEFQRQ
jgi:uncharacterized protein (DUF1800 family)